MMEIIKTYSLKISQLALCIGICAALFLYNPQVILASPLNFFNIPHVVVDPGHGKPDSGTSRGSLHEKDINLKISLEVARLLRKKGIQVTLTRQDDQDLATPDDEKNRRRHRADLKRRLTVIRQAKPDAAILIHCNWSSRSSTNGAIVILHPSNQESNQLAKQVIDSLHRSQIKVRSSANHSLYLLKRIKAPCILVEVGFLSNQSEAKRLATPEYQKKLAMAIESGVKTYLRLNH